MKTRWPMGTPPRSSTNVLCVAMIDSAVGLRMVLRGILLSRSKTHRTAHPARRRPRDRCAFHLRGVECKSQIVGGLEDGGPDGRQMEPNRELAAATRPRPRVGLARSSANRAHRCSGRYSNTATQIRRAGPSYASRGRSRCCSKAPRRETDAGCVGEWRMCGQRGPSRVETIPACG